jgi:hypothetical protein
MDGHNTLIVTPKPLTRSKGRLSKFSAEPTVI